MLCFVGRSIHRIYDSATENNYLCDFKNIISEKDSLSVNDDDLVIICTGSQGETNAALSRIADDNNKYIGITENDLIIFSSRVIPGNEKKISELQNKLIKKNVQFFMIKILKRMFPVILLKKNLKKCMIGYHQILLYLFMVNLDI